MLHLFHGFIAREDELSYLDNGLFGIEVIYHGFQHEGTYYLFPQFDQNNQTYKYYAFDSVLQKQDFLRLLKIQGIGGKTAYHISWLDRNDLAAAIESFDLKFFQKIPGIGPKTAKRVLVEMKQNFDKQDIQKLNMDEKLLQDIMGSLKSLGYQSTMIKKLLPDVPVPMERERLPEIMKWLINNL